MLEGGETIKIFENDEKVLVELRGVTQQPPSRTLVFSFSKKQLLRNDQLRSGLSSRVPSDSEQREDSVWRQTQEQRLRASARLLLRPQALLVCGTLTPGGWETLGLHSLHPV